jgi:ATP-binding cassette, subfamily C (CFTR/MRP), member 1
MDADSGTSGLVMSYMLQTAQTLSGLVLLRTQIEAEMVSIQRIFAVADIEPEPSTALPSSTPPAPLPAAWPTQGQITLRNVTAGYASGPPALRGVSLDIPAGQSTAVVGRTGAGKSSLAAVLVRVLAPRRGGTVSVDGRDIAGVDVAALRARVAVVPQNCRAFAGSVRENLDPYGDKDETDLRRAVRESKLAEYLGGSEEEALEFEIASGG